MATSLLQFRAPRCIESLVPARKPLSVQTAVVARKTLGESNSKIAKELDIARGTVVSILDSSGFNAALEFGRVRVHRMIPKACDELEYGLKRHQLAASLAILNGTGVLRPANEQTTHVNVQMLVQIQSQSRAIVAEIMEIQQEDVRTIEVDGPTKPEKVVDS